MACIRSQPVNCFPLKVEKKQKKSKTGIKAGMFLLLAIMVVSTPVMESQAAEDVIENIYEEHQ